MSDIFEDDTFVLYGKDTKKIEDQIAECGGLVAQKLTKRVTIVVCEDPSAYSDEVKKAEDQKVPVVTEAYVSDSLAKKQRLKPEDYKADAAPAAKKQKTDSNAVIANNSEWNGVCVSKDDTYVFKLTVTNRNGDNFEGTISWPDVGDALTKCRGKIEDASVTFEEYEAINGEDEVELPQYYTATLTGNVLNGKLKDVSGETSSFKLSLYQKRTHNKTTSSSNTSTSSSSTTTTTTTAVKRDFSTLVAGTKITGVHSLVYPFEMNVATRTNNGVVKGNILWPTADSTTTRFEGKVSAGDIVSIEEVELIKGDGVEVPVKYDGKVTGDTFSGNYVAVSSNNGGAFKLTKVK